MKFISPKLHGVIDLLVVVFLLASPTIFNFTGLLATFTYALAGVHLVLTLLTDFGMGVIKVIPLQVHGAIELIVGVVLIVLAYTLFNDPAQIGKLYYTAFGAAVLLTWLFSDYKKPATV